MDRVWSREYYVDFTKKEELDVSITANGTCRVFGFEQVKEFSTISSSALDVWKVSGPSQVEHSEEPLSTVRRRPSKYKSPVYRFPLDAFWQVGIASGWLTWDFLWYKLNYKEGLNAPVTGTIVLTVGITAGVVAFIPAVALTPLVAIAKAVEKNHNAPMLNKEVPHLHFNRLICQ